MGENARTDDKRMRTADGHPEPSSVTASNFREAMASFAAGVTIVTTIDSSGRPHALTATAFSSVSLSPPLCLVCIDRRSRTYQSVVRKGCFAVNILNANQQALSVHFASSVIDKFEAVRWRAGDVTGCPIIESALAWMECGVAEVYSGGDHDIFLGRVASVRVHDGKPLVYWRGSYSSLPPAGEEASTIPNDRKALGLPYA
jgi:flavin reductase (DIM6/NTAB) family NADH-FMN oxidoreductase RutF